MRARGDFVVGVGCGLDGDPNIYIGFSTERGFTSLTEQQVELLAEELAASISPAQRKALRSEGARPHLPRTVGKCAICGHHGKDCTANRRRKAKP